MYRKPLRARTYAQISTVWSFPCGCSIDDSVGGRIESTSMSVGSKSSARCIEIKAVVTVPLAATLSGSGLHLGPALAKVIVLSMRLNVVWKYLKNGMPKIHTGPC